jgi:long-chain acyl-CoA synthetase
VGVPLLEGYGLTEAGPVVSISPPEEEKPGTVGRPLPNLDVRMVDDDGRPLGVGSEGEIEVRGPSVMSRYWRRPDETRAAIGPEGWLRTGNLGSLDAEGYLRIHGRRKELIITGGENVHPAEIEEALLGHPAVAEAAVVAEPDRLRGEVPVAYVTLVEGRAAGAEELSAHVRRHLASFKVPKRFEFREELPRGPTGKIAKKALAGRGAT